MFERMRLGIDANSCDKEGYERSHQSSSRPGLQTMAVQGSNTSATSSNFNTASAPKSSGSTEQPYPLDPHKEEPASDRRLLQLKHHLSLLGTIHEEISNTKYDIPPTSHTRMKVGIQEIVYQEMYLLASPYGDDWLKLVRDHFAAYSARSDVASLQSNIRGHKRSHSPDTSDDQVASDILDKGTCSVPGSQVSSIVKQGSPRFVELPRRPQCWDHGCNGRQFSTFSDLLRHQREKHGILTKSTCYCCGVEFTRKSAHDEHRARGSCEQRKFKPSHTPAIVENATAMDDKVGVQDTTTVQPHSEGQRGSKRSTGNVVDDLVAMWTLLPDD